MRFRKPLVTVAAALALAACASSSSAPVAPGASPKGTVVIGAAVFTEIALMAEIYDQLLKSKGYTTERKTVQNRELYLPEVEKGNIDVVPEYAATLAEFLNVQVNGKSAAPVASSDATATVAAINKLGNPLGLFALTPAQAVDQNAFAVKKDFATSNNLTTLSQLGQLGKPVVVAAVEECLTRKFCGGVLKDDYKVNISKILPTGFGTPQTKKAVQDGIAQLGLVGSTDASLEDFELVLLQDDLKVQLADNLTPLVGKKYSTDADLTAVLNSLSSALTTEDLTALIRKVDSERMKPADVAKAWLTDKGLISS